MGMLSRMPYSGFKSINILKGYYVSPIPFRMKTRGVVSFKNLLSEEPGLMYVFNTYVILPVRSKRCLGQQVISY